MTIRALVVDDEPLAREKLLALLADESDIEVVGECGTGSSAVDAIERNTPDLVFLDVQMPELDGFGILERLDDAHTPAVIFVTAYDQYALQAFDVHALDFLLKPFDRQRLVAALEKARRQILNRRTGELRERLQALLEDLQGEQQYLERMVVKSSGRVFFLKVEDVDWLEAAANYVRLHVGSEGHLVRETMANLEKKLDPQRFLRIHRSTIVQIDRIQELRQLFHGDYAVVLENGKQLPVSRGYRERLNQLLGRPA